MYREKEKYEMEDFTSVVYLDSPLDQPFDKCKGYGEKDNDFDPFAYPEIGHDLATIRDK